MSPPELSGNTPVLDIISPVEICLVHSFRNQLDLTILYCLYSRFNQLIHLNEPLLFYQWLNRSLTTVMCAYIVAVILNLNEKSHLIQFFYDGFPCCITIHTCELTTIFINGSIIIHNVDDRQIMSLTYFKVVRVMGRCNLNNACTEFHIYVSIFYDRNLTIHNRK